MVHHIFSIGLSGPTESNIQTKVYIIKYTRIIFICKPTDLLVLAIELRLRLGGRLKKGLNVDYFCFTEATALRTLPCWDNNSDASS